MKKFYVEVAMLVRETRVVVVEAPDEETLERHLSDVYEVAAEALGDWVSDAEWGCEEGTHTIVGEVDEPQEVVEVVVDSVGAKMAPEVAS